MKPAKPRRTLLGGLGLVLLSAGVGSHPRQAEAEPPSVAAPKAETASDAAPAVADSPAPGVEAPAGFVDGPLVGRPGAATALAVRDPDTALALLDGQPAPLEGTAAWFRHGALRGRALRMLGRMADAVTVLEPLASHKALSDHFAPELLGYELALARQAWAADGSLSVELADEQRKRAVAELGKVRRSSPMRNLAELRVLQGELMVAITGGEGRSATRAASKAAKAIAKIIADYPNHPRIGVLRMNHARALVRAGKATEAAAIFRSVMTERAGEPEAEQAWTELSALAEGNRKVSSRRPSTGEKLEQAVYARGLRRVKESRRILDAMADDEELSSSRRRQARRSRSYTAYKQRDFERCADDLRPMYAERGNVDVRDWLLRCLERGEMYDEALGIWEARTKSDRASTRLNALWNGLILAFRAGRYQQAQTWLREYESMSKGHRGERRWLGPWLAYRLGRTEEAIEGLRAVASGYGSDARRGRYFLGKVLLASADPTLREKGATKLQQIAVSDAWGYYGLMARQRLLDAGVETPPLPELLAVADESRPPSRASAETTLAELDARFGEAWPSIRRTRQLYEAGYLEEARRELRYGARAYLDHRHGHSPGPRSEAIYIGLGWKAEWEYPRARTTSKGRKTLRSSEDAEALREGFRSLAHDLSEPYMWAKLSTSSDGAYKARWHPRAYRASVEREARLRGIDPIHMWSLMYTESRFRRHVVSPVGARGALQIMPWTGRQLSERLDEMPDDGRFNPDVLFDIDTNAHLAGYYVSELLAKFHGQAPMAYASYNGGPSNV
ncbi:MAG: transglycosylase SLT domain-containing protein, partial [Deltaproteobacteria bacterium]|nr:transglycosylase SLT domain-containing protein [Deltaproteobacteria bacterium]